MHRRIKVGAVATLVGLSCATFASAAKDTWDGPSDDKGETVSIKLKENKNGEPRKVVSFTSDQGGKCGSITLEPKKPRKLDEEGNFTLKLKFSGQVVFKVTGGVVATGVMQGEYEQVACDGFTDTWVAYDED